MPQCIHYSFHALGLLSDTAAARGHASTLSWRHAPGVCTYLPWGSGCTQYIWLDLPMGTAPRLHADISGRLCGYHILCKAPGPACTSHPPRLCGACLWYTHKHQTAWDCCRGCCTWNICALLPKRGGTCPYHTRELCQGACSGHLARRVHKAHALEFAIHPAHVCACRLCVGGAFVHKCRLCVGACICV